MRIWSGVVLALATGPASAQQILEVDTEAGRELAGGEEYAFLRAVVDYGRRLVLVSEIADLAVTAYSLDDGSVQGVFGGGRRGDGPGELSSMSVGAIAVGPDGVFMSGAKRVLYWSWSGALLHQWTPTAPLARVLCALNGRPAVTLQEGLVFRGDDGESVALGGEASAQIKSASPASVRDDMDAYLGTKMACSDSAAYLLVGSRHLLTEYKLGAEPRVLDIPEEVVEAVRWMMDANDLKSAYGRLFLAEDSRLVLTTANPRVTATLLDPATGCYALLKNMPWQNGVSYVGMFGDSVVTMEASREPMERRMVNGKVVPVFSSERTHIFVRPVRPVEGEPCS